MNTEWYYLLLVVFIGMVAGFINTLAGGGSLLILPFLIFLGLPASVANGTNRIGILMQNLVATLSFKKQNVLDYKAGYIMGIPAVLGSFMGALMAVDINDEILEKIIGGILIFMVFVMIYKPEKWLVGDVTADKKQHRFFRILIFFFIGFYGGFIQAGVGYFLLAGLVLGAGYDLVKANAIKVFIGLLFTPIALVVFIYNNQVEYILGIVLAFGNMAGAYLAAKMAVKKGAKFIRIILIVTLVATAAKLFGFFDYFH